MDACERLIDQLPFYSFSRLSFIRWGGLVKNVSQLLFNEALWKFVYTSHIPTPFRPVGFTSIFLESLRCVLFILRTDFVFSTVRQSDGPQPFKGRPTVATGSYWSRVILRHGLAGAVHRMYVELLGGVTLVGDVCVCVCSFFCLFPFLVLIPATHTPLPFASLSLIVATHTWVSYESKSISSKNSGALRTPP